MSAPQDGGLYQVMNNSSKTVWSMEGSATSENNVGGEKVIFPLETQGGGPTAQQVWAFSKSTINGQDWWTIVNADHPNVLTISSVVPSSSGVPIVLIPKIDGGDDSQLWKITTHRNTLNSLPGPTWCTFTNKATGSAADLFNANPAPGTPVQAWPATDNNPHQAFVLIPNV